MYQQPDIHREDEMKAKKQKEIAYTNGICVDLKTNSFSIFGMVFVKTGLSE